jgi:hypothetical protein
MRSKLEQSGYTFQTDNKHAYKRKRRRREGGYSFIFNLHAFKNLKIVKD